MNGAMMMMLQKLPTLLMATFKLAGREKFQSHKSWLSKYLLQFSFPPAWREQILCNKNISKFSARYLQLCMYACNAAKAQRNNKGWVGSMMLNTNGPTHQPRQFWTFFHFGIFSFLHHIAKVRSYYTSRKSITSRPSLVMF